MAPPRSSLRVPTRLRIRVRAYVLKGFHTAWLGRYVKEVTVIESSVIVCPLRAAEIQRMGSLRKWPRPSHKVAKPDLSLEPALNRRRRSSLPSHRRASSRLNPSGRPPTHCLGSESSISPEA